MYPLSLHNEAGRRLRVGTPAYQDVWERARLRLLPGAWVGRVRTKVEAFRERELARLLCEGAILPDVKAENLANGLLHDLTAPMEGVRVPLGASDADIVAMAKARARTMLELAAASPVKTASGVRRLLLASAASWGVRLPDDTTDAGVIGRLTDPLFWRRQLRAVHGRELEGHAIRLGYVHRKAAPYCSDDTLLRRQQQKARNAATLAENIAVNDAGDQYALAELAALSVANPRIRRGELMTRIAGFEAMALELGHVGEFVTITCPSRMHARLAATGAENPAYDGTTPRQAQAYLSKVFSRIRPAMQRAGLAVYGFRIAEPHHDGCPHWHMLVFLPGGDRERFRAIVARYAMAADARELDSAAARAARVKFIEIDGRRGSAAGYIAKYVAKNIDGYALDRDLFGNDALTASARVEAWAATWGIRQFQQIGGPPVGVWRELRRIRAEEAAQSRAVADARAAADAGAWADYVRVMGGPLLARKLRPLAVARAVPQVTDGRTGEVSEAKNRYGEQAAPRAYGVADRWKNVVVASVRHVWTVTRRAVLKAAGALCERLSKGASGRAASPWTRVNNCTGVGDGQQGGSAESGGADGGTRVAHGEIRAGRRALDDSGGQIDGRNGRHAGANKRRDLGATSPA